MTSSSGLQRPAGRVVAQDSGVLDVVKMAQKTLTCLKCEWAPCSTVLNSWVLYRQHILNHCRQAASSTNPGPSVPLAQCRWKLCASRSHVGLVGLISHVENQHLTKVPLPCPLKECHAEFTRANLLEEHYARDHRQYHPQLHAGSLDLSPTMEFRSTAKRPHQSSTAPPLLPNGTSSRQKIPTYQIQVLVASSVTVRPPDTYPLSKFSRQNTPTPSASSTLQMQNRLLASPARPKGLYRKLDKKLSRHITPIPPCQSSPSQNPSGVSTSSIPGPSQEAPRSPPPMDYPEDDNDEEPCTIAFSPMDHRDLNYHMINVGGWKAQIHGITSKSLSEERKHLSTLMVREHQFSRFSHDYRGESNPFDFSTQGWSGWSNNLFQ